MILNWQLKSLLICNLQYLEKSKANIATVKILKIILDEKKTEDALKHEISNLQKIVDNIDIDFLATMNEVGIRYHIGSDMLNVLWLLGICYRYGISIEKDIKQAVMLFQLAAKQGHVVSQINLGFCYEYGCGVAKIPEISAYLFQRAAEQGHAAAQNILGFYHLNGHSVVVKDKKNALKLFQMAAEQGYAEAQTNLGSLYENGLGVKKNLKTAVQLYQQGAQQSHPAALSNLALCYRQGLGVAKNLNTAVILYSKAKEQRCAAAQYNLAICYEDGVGVTKDQKHALVLYLQAAEQSEINAVFKLGLCYQQGLGTAQDFRRAVMLFLKAWQSGFEPAKIIFYQHIRTINSSVLRPEEIITFFLNEKDYSTLGFCYQLGLGVDQDSKKAVEYFTLAIMQNPSCIWDLFLCYQGMSSKLDKKVFSEFYKDLLEEFNRTNLPSNLKLYQEKLRCLAYLYEHGGPYFEQDLYKVSKFFQKIQDANDLEIKSAHERYAMLPAFQVSVQKACKLKRLYNDDIASIIAEYAYEPSTNRK